MICPHCQSDNKSHVIDSRDHYEVRRRRHFCNDCKGRFTTYEISAEEYERLTFRIDTSQFDGVIAALRAIKVQFNGTRNGLPSKN